MNIRHLHNLVDFREASRRTLPRMVFDYIDGAAGNEETARENRAALEKIRLVPSGPVNIAARSTAIELFGRPMAMPLIIGPTGMTSAFWPKGELALARAAGTFGIPYVLANGSSVTFDEVMRAETAGTGRKWFQLYMPPTREIASQWLESARAAGFEALELTVDTALPGLRTRDMRNVFSSPFRWSPGKLLDVMSRPAWALRMAPHGMPTPSLMVGKPAGKQATVSDSVRARLFPALSWDDVRWVRDQWQAKLIVKGLTDPHHARHAVSVGLDGIVVSNHGGRQLDGAVSSIEVLPDFVSEIGGKMPILIDSGFRTGSDIAKAIALGATAVQIGRATLYGLSVGGEAGASRVLNLLKDEFDVAMALCGACSPSQLNGRCVRLPGEGWNRGHGGDEFGPAPVSTTPSS